MKVAVTLTNNSGEVPVEPADEVKVEFGALTVYRKNDLVAAFAVGHWEHFTTQ